MSLVPTLFVFFFFNDTATTEIYTLSLHDALPIYDGPGRSLEAGGQQVGRMGLGGDAHGRQQRQPPGQSLGWGFGHVRSEEHTSELQSRLHLVCRLLLEKKKTY